MSTLNAGQKPTSVADGANTLNASQKLISVAVGVTLWLAFIFVVRSIPWAFDGGVRSVLLFLLTVPLTWSFVVFLKKIASLTSETLFEAVALATFAALLLDGLVFTFFSQWYGHTQEHIRYGAGFIFWGAGMGMLVAWLMRGSSPQR